MSTVPVAAATTHRIALDDPLLISDLHLSHATPRTLAAFGRFMHTVVPRHSELVVLGDLFESWVGDDDDDAVAHTVIAWLLAARRHGVRVFVMHGNRDLLLGERFARVTGAVLLADPTIAEVRGRVVMLSHGDAWCTQDAAYQQFRARVRDAAWQSAFLSQPLAERRAFVGQARAASESAKQVKTMDIMDVTATAVDEAFRASDVACIVHGHTHRPAVHRHQLDGTERERWVLPDWDLESADTPRGGYVRFDGGTWVVEPVASLLAAGAAGASAVSH